VLPDGRGGAQDGETAAAHDAWRCGRDPGGGMEDPRPEVDTRTVVEGMHLQLWACHLWLVMAERPGKYGDLRADARGGRVNYASRKFSLEKT
jgi:hypothetical protein